MKFGVNSLRQCILSSLSLGSGYVDQANGEPNGIPWHKNAVETNNLNRLSRLIIDTLIEKDTIMLSHY